ncbi:MAG: ABC transporter permease subunit [Candidatus Zipacnadales bacterium]
MSSTTPEDSVTFCPQCHQPVLVGMRACHFCGTDIELRPPQSPSRRLGTRALDALGGYAFLAPNVIGFLIFTLLPILAAFLLSFTEWDAVTPITSLPEAKKLWVGTSHYRDILGFHRNEAGRLEANDQRFWQYAYNTIFLMLGIPIGMFLSLLCALLMNQKLKGIIIFRTVYFIPSICSAIAIAMLWKWLYDPRFGLINELLRSLHLVTPTSGGLFNGVLETIGLKQPGEPLKWLADVRLAKPALILMGLWAAIGGQNCILYLAGLQGIPEELYEAAEIDGASWWHKLRYITWPMLAPTTFFILVMSIIHGFQAGFVAIHTLTRGGPAGATTNLLYYIYNHAFEWFKMGRASALAMILFAVVFTLTAINWKYGRRGVEYL